MRCVLPEEFSLVLDAILRTILESRYGRHVWSLFQADRTRLSAEVWAVLNDQAVWFDLARSVSPVTLPLAAVRSDSYLQKVADLFLERAGTRFRIPMPRIDPCIWDRYSTERWRAGRHVLAVLTGPERLPVIETVSAIQEARVGIDPDGWRVIGVAIYDWIPETGSAAKAIVINERSTPVFV